MVGPAKFSAKSVVGDSRKWQGTWSKKESGAMKAEFELYSEGLGDTLKYAEQ